MCKINGALLNLNMAESEYIIHNYVFISVQSLENKRCHVFVEPFIASTQPLPWSPPF